MEGGSFFERLYGHLLIAGNAYVERVDLPSGRMELHLLRPERVTVETDADGWPQALVYRSGLASRTIPVAGLDAPGLHLKLFHPLDDHYGFPPLEAALMALDIHNAAGAWNKALLDNSARPSGALVYAPKEGGNLTEEQFERLKAELEEGYTGASGAGRPLLLEGGLDWKAMGYSPQDMDFIEAKNGAARDIALRLRRSAHAARYPRRQYLCQLCRGQPCFLPADRAAIDRAYRQGFWQLAGAALWRRPAA